MGKTWGKPKKSSKFLAQKFHGDDFSDLHVLAVVQERCSPGGPPKDGRNPVDHGRIS
jgi:hypothetical protein